MRIHAMESPVIALLRDISVNFTDDVALSMEKQRARKPDEKAERKQSIVNSLKSLLLQSHYPLPSANDIARATGMSKGVIYHYFNSREEIFLTLFIQEGQALYAGLADILTPEHYDLIRVRQFMVGFFCNHDVFCYLGLIAPSILENNVSIEFVTNMKQTFAQLIQQLAEHWVALEPGLVVSEVRYMILQFYHAALMQWQHCHPPKLVQQAFEDQHVWLLSSRLEEDLQRNFDWLYLGMRSQNNLSD